MDRSFSALPIWFRRLGLGAWLVVGMVLVLIGAVWLLGKTASIVDPTEAKPEREQALMTLGSLRASMAPLARGTFRLVDA